MTDECISPLRRRMIEDMTVRNFVPKTQSDYIRRVKNFAGFLGRTPDRASREDVRGYLLHLASSDVALTPDAGEVFGVKGFTPWWERMQALPSYESTAPQVG